MTPPQSAKPRIEKLSSAHAVHDFDCGNDALNRFLKQHALQNHHASASQTYVGLIDNTVVGYHTLAVGHVEHHDAPSRLTKGLAKYPIPIMLLARLAVDNGWQRQGIGSGLLRDAMLRTLQAAEIAGIRAIAVHAKNQQARQFYERFEFIASPTDPLHLILLLKDIDLA